MQHSTLPRIAFSIFFVALGLLPAQAFAQDRLKSMPYSVACDFSHVSAVKTSSPCAGRLNWKSMQAKM